MLAVLIAISALATMTQPYKIDSLFVFLSTLGIIVPPLCGIILADFYLVHRGKYIDYNKATFYCTQSLRILLNLMLLVKAKGDYHGNS